MYNFVEELDGALRAVDVGGVRRGVVMEERTDLERSFVSLEQ